MERLLTGRFLSGGQKCLNQELQPKGANFLPPAESPAGGSSKILLWGEGPSRFPAGSFPEELSLSLSLSRPLSLSLSPSPSLARSHSLPRSLPLSSLSLSPPLSLTRRLGCQEVSGEEVIERQREKKAVPFFRSPPAAPPSPKKRERKMTRERKKRTRAIQICLNS